MKFKDLPIASYFMFSELNMGRTLFRKTEKFKYAFAIHGFETKVGTVGLEVIETDPNGNPKSPNQIDCPACQGETVGYNLRERFCLKCNNMFIFEDPSQSYKYKGIDVTLIYPLLEAVADIAFIAGEKGFYSGDSRQDIQIFIDLALEFEKRNGGVEWGVEDRDYIEEIGDFADAQLAKHGDFQDHR